jgi:DNA repair protein RadC
MSYLGIKSWAEDDRPREKMSLKGKSVLSNAELIAILIGSGTREKSAVELAQQILDEADNNLNVLAKKNIQELMLHKGIGEAKAISIVAAMELTRRKTNEEKPLVKVIQSSDDAYQYMKPTFSDLQHEEFHILLLNRRNVVIAMERISQGGIAGTVVDGKMIFKKALDFKASYLVLAHNHPSGNHKPSEQDLQLTKKLVSFGKFIDLPIVDHLIITDNNYFSFADNGNL